MAKKMLIDATHLEETRVVVVDGNKVDDFDFESVAKRQLAGNIYLAKVTRVEPSLQAAFVDYGGNRHGFLAFAEIHPDYYQIPVADREALIAEEAAEQERSEAGEVRRDAEAEKAEARKRRPRRRKGGKQAQGEQDTAGQSGVEQARGEQNPAEPETAVTEPEAEGGSDEPAPAAPARKGRTPRRSRKADKHKSSGLEVIDFDEGGSGNDGGAGGGTDVRGLEIAEVPGSGGEDGDANDGGNDTPPKTMAEKTGLDEAETVSEDVESDKVPGKTARKSPGNRGKSRRRPHGDGGGTDSGESAADTAGDTAGDAPGETAIESIEPDEPQEEAARARAKLRRRYRIQDVVKVRQIMLVQVVKEERGTKGAALTTYLSLPGRYCVLMPNTARGGGISRKITNAADRKRLREVVDELDVPTGMGLIVRTAGAERTRAEIKRDFEFLLRQWEQIRELTLNSIAPTLIYEEGSLIKRSIRDLYSKDIDAILVEGETGYREAKDYMKMLMPSHARHVQQYTDRIPLFIRYQVESYLSGMFNPVVQMRSGGYIVIGQTEALVAIDVNSGRSTRESSIEETALKTNLEAADEIARQLRLRDLAGLIVIDFIDMDDSRNNRAVEKRLKERLKVDRARLQLGRISPFGLLEMSRQRLRPGMVEISTQPCPHCHGQGVIRSNESLALSMLREVEEEGVRGRAAEVTVAAPVSIANYIINTKRRHLAQIEERYGLSVLVVADPEFTSPEYRIEPSKTRTRRPEAATQVVTAESAVVATGVEAPEAEAAAPPPEERDKGEGEGRTRRRRGKRGGRRRRGQDGEASDGRAEARAETHSGSQPSTDAPQSPADADAPSEVSEAASGSGSEAEAKPEDERRPRKRRGGRGRGRQDEAGAGEAPQESVQEAEAAEPAAETSPAATAEPGTVIKEPQDEPSEEPAAETPARPAEAAQARREDAEATVSEAAPEPASAPTRRRPKAEESGPKRRGWWQWR